MKANTIQPKSLIHTKNMIQKKKNLSLRIQQTSKAIQNSLVEQ